jgi:hypothetical protein
MVNRGYFSQYVDAEGIENYYGKCAKKVNELYVQRIKKF